jgi:pimeloyl-ACP methyl ester carboxylesterase
MPIIDVMGMRLHYLAAGEAPRPSSGAACGAAGCVVFVHGAGGNGGHWQAQLDGLPPGWRGLALDLPGHGGSAGPGHRTIAEYRDVVVACLRAARAAPAVLVGHSMGGAIAQAVALAQPGVLRGLVLVGTGARLRVHPSLLEALRQDPLEAARLLLDWGFGAAAPPALRDEGARDLLRCPAQVIEGDFRACDGFDVMAEVGRISVPSLIVCGEQDALTPPKYARFLHQEIPGSHLALVPEAGHYVMRERPSAVNAALGEFLAGLRLRG